MSNSIPEVKPGRMTDQARQRLVGAWDESWQDGDKVCVHYLVPHLDEWVQAGDRLADAFQELLDWRRTVMWNRFGNTDAEIDAALAEYVDALKAWRGILCPRGAEP